MSIAPTQAEIDAMEASSRDPAIERAGEAMMNGDIYTAEATLREVLARRPNDFVAIRMLGEIAASVGILTDAEALFRQSLRLAPGFAYARLHLAAVLHDQDRPVEALAEIARMSGELVDYPETKALLPGVFMADNLHPDAKGYDIWGEAVIEPLSRFLK